MAVSRNSKTSPGFKRRAQTSRSPFAPIAVFVLLGLLSASAIVFFYQRGDLLCYGDAVAHINIARRIVDSRTPGWDQVGTVWLPLPHLLMLPLVSWDRLWQTGLAGSIASGVCFVFAGLLFFLAARRAFSSDAAAAAACAALALNPNVLYLQSIGMTEAVFLAALAATLYCTLRFRDSESLAWAAAAGVAAAAGSLIRYDGWFLIPFTALYLLLAGKRHRLLAPLVFSLIAASGPLLWLAHNWWHFGNALEFYSGPHSAKAIQGAALYPGERDFPKAWLYYRTAVRLCAGWPLALLGLAGIVATLRRRVYWPLALLALPPLFYILSVHSAGTPIFVPVLWPNSYYNTRYGIAALPLLAFAAAGLTAIAPERFRALAAAGVILASAAPWLAYPRTEGWICWKESQVNSEARRAWTAETAEYLGAHLHPGDGVLTSFGDLIGVFQRAGIPLSRTLHEGNGLIWTAAITRPGLFLWERWAVAIAGDPVSTALRRNWRGRPRYDCVRRIAVRGAPVIEVFRRAP